MFGTTPRPATGSPAASSKRGSFSVLGAEVAVTGDITAVELHLDGRIKGDVACASLVQGASGHVDGSVTAESARIAGAVTGAISVGELTIERTARITGDIAYQSLAIETGAVIDGQVRRLKAVGDASDDEPLVLETRADDPPLLVRAEEAAA